MNKRYHYPLNGKFEHKIISKGDNFPSLDLSESILNRLCVLLHHQIQKEEIISYLEISEEEFELKISALMREGLIKQERSNLSLTFPCITHDDGKEFYQLSKEVGNKIEKLILNNLDAIMTKTHKIKSLSTYRFEKLSFFILSGVILDFIQIDYIEKYFLQSERPVRNGKKYYFAFMQKTSAAKEPFGIYGNHCKSFGDFSLCMYGNERYSMKSFITMSEEEIKRELNIPREFQLTQLIHMIRNGEQIDSQMARRMEKLHLLNDDLTIPIINKEEYECLMKVANILTADLINILKDEHTALIEACEQSQYYRETTFEEYFIWYYHFLYTYVTEILINKGVITKPKSGVFSYILI